MSVSSKSTEANAKLKPQLQLFPYQEEGVERLVQDRRLLLADEMGLGKTVQCISAMNRICSSDSNVLVVCPKSVIGVWKSEIQTWGELPLEVQVASPKAFPSPTPTTTNGSITLINYDICHKYRESLHEAQYDIVICDEAHYLKSITAKRTRVILGDGNKHAGLSSPHLWLLTGTPVLNRPVELYPLLRALDPVEFASFSEYADLYCDPKPVQRRRGASSSRFFSAKDYSGASNLTSLSERLKPLMLRRHKATVLAQLPPKFRSCVRLEADGGQDVANSERDRLQAMLPVMISSSSTTTSTTISRSSSRDDHNDDADDDSPSPFSNNDLDGFGSDATDLASYLSGAAGLPSHVDLQDPDNYNRVMGLLATVRKETAMTKLEPATELLRDIVLSEQKVVVFCHHRDLILGLAERFGGGAAVCVLGGMDPDERSDAVRRFQQDPSVRIFVGSIRAAGVGLTLTAASRVVFLELDWSPGVMAQAEDRCHRVGQRDCVQVQYYVFQNTLDEWIAKSLMWKQSNIDQILPDASDSIQTGYAFDFGKHKGTRLEDVPRNYVQFLVRNEVWRNRPSLWRALSMKGFVLEQPPALNEDHGAAPNENDGAVASNENSMSSTVNSPDTPAGYASLEDDTIVVEAPHSAFSVEDDLDTTLQDNSVHDQNQPPLIVHRTDHPAVTVLSPARLEQRRTMEKPPDRRLQAVEMTVEYVFDFGKHSGKSWDQVPQAYRDWIVQAGVWKNRENLKKSLEVAGIV